MILLASKSPRRKKLLEESGLPFRVVSQDADESHGGDLSPEEVVRLLCERKAEVVLPFCGKNDVVLSADTVVACEGRILGKPEDKADAIAMLTFLSGKKQSVLTGVCLANPEKKIVVCEESVVVFRDLSRREIEDYVERESPLDKAGAYAVQEGGGGFVARLEGDYDNVVGLPLSRTVSLLKKEFGDCL